MKTAKEYWKDKFDEYPQTDADKLAVAMMTEFAEAYHEDKTRELNEELKSLRCELNAIYESEAGADL